MRGRGLRCGALLLLCGACATEPSARRVAETETVVLRPPAQSAPPAAAPPASVHSYEIWYFWTGDGGNGGEVGLPRAVKLARRLEALEKPAIAITFVAVEQDQGRAATARRLLMRHRVKGEVLSATEGCARLWRLGADCRSFPVVMLRHGDGIAFLSGMNLTEGESDAVVECASARRARCR